MENSFVNLSVCQGILINIQIKRIHKNDNVRTLKKMFIDCFNATHNAIQSNVMLNKCAITRFSFFFYLRAIQMVMREISECIAVGWAADWKLLLESHFQNRFQTHYYYLLKVNRVYSDSYRFIALSKR